MATETEVKSAMSLLETPCDSCKGEGGWQLEGRWVECRNCGGAGCFASELGQDVLDFIRRNFWRIAPERQIENQMPDD